MNKLENNTENQEIFYFEEEDMNGDIYAKTHDNRCFYFRKENQIWEDISQDVQHMKIVEETLRSKKYSVVSQKDTNESPYIYTLEI